MIYSEDGSVIKYLDKGTNDEVDNKNVVLTMGSTSEIPA
jgi:hypothetical protein